MCKERKELLKDLDRVLNITHRMLTTVRKRNSLLESSQAKEAEFRKKSYEYKSFISLVEDFTKDYEKDELEGEVKEFISFIEKKLKGFQEVALPYIKSAQKSWKLTNEADSLKEPITIHKEEFRNLRLEKDEIPKDKLYELAALLLLFNEEDSSITEDSLFKEKSDFYELIKESEDSVLMELLGYGDITDTNIFGFFMLQLK